MDILKQLVQTVEKEGLGLKNVVLRRHDRILARHDFAPEERLLLWSVSKSVTSMAVGIALSEGRFALTDKIVDFFPEEGKKASPGMEKVTIRDLLCMGVGQEICAIDRALSEQTPIEDVMAMFFAEPVVYAPGTHFTYNNCASYMLGRVITKTTGEMLVDYLRPRIFDPMGLENITWERCPRGFCQGFAGLSLNATELSMMGQLVLNRGRWGDKQLVPAAYLQEATRPQISTSDYTPFFATADHHQGYGYHFWMNRVPGTCRMDGMYGQYCVILPEQDAVIAFTSAEPERMTAILELSWELMGKL